MRISVSFSTAALTALIFVPGVLAAQQDASGADSTATAAAVPDSVICAAITAEVRKAFADPRNVTRDADGRVQIRIGQPAAGAPDTVGQAATAGSDTAAAGTTRRQVHCPNLTITQTNDVGAQ